MKKKSERYSRINELQKKTKFDLIELIMQLEDEVEQMSRKVNGQYENLGRPPIEEYIVNRIYEMREQGSDYRTIAHVLGISKSTVGNYMAKRKRK